MRAQLIAFAVNGAVFLQAQAGLPGFEVASVRLSRSGSLQEHVFTTPGRLTLENASLKFIILQAFGLQSFQLAGGPSWLEKERYDIVAKADAPANAEQLKQMLQPLLIDRVKLRFHHEMREQPTYALVLNKDGSKLETTTAGSDTSVRIRGGANSITLIAESAEMSALANVLTRVLHRNVIDRTRLGGFFRFQVTFFGALSKSDWTIDADQPPPGVDTPPQIFTALQRDLGLRLEAQKAPVDVLVIDNVEKMPTDN